MKHTIVVIGTLGSRRCYLDVSREEAFQRYCKSEEVREEDIQFYVELTDEFEFGDEFRAYDAYAKD